MTESWEWFGVKVAREDMLSLMESEEASFERERFLMMSLMKLRELFPLRGSLMDMSDTEGAYESLEKEWASLGRERREAVEGDGRNGLCGKATARLWGWEGRGHGRTRRSVQGYPPAQTTARCRDCDRAQRVAPKRPGRPGGAAGAS